MKRKMKLLFTIVLLQTIIISNASANIIVDKPETKDESSNDSIFDITNDNDLVDPDIVIQQDMLPYLTQTYDEIDDTDFKKIINCMINELEYKTSLYSYDIEKILKKLNIQNVHVALGLVNAEVQYIELCGNTGNEPIDGCFVTGIPFLFTAYYNFWVGENVFIWWAVSPAPDKLETGEGYNRNNFKINIKDVYFNRGVAIKTYGTWSSYFYWDIRNPPKDDTEWGVNIHVASPLILYREYEQNNKAKINDNFHLLKIIKDIFSKEHDIFNIKEQINSSYLIKQIVKRYSI